jgi:predicted nucleotidyltransferase
VTHPFLLFIKAPGSIPVRASKPLHPVEALEVLLYNPTMTTTDEEQRNIQQMVNRIADQFHPEKIYLFGSRARGENHPRSDVDLLVVMSFQGDRRKNRLAMRVAVHDVQMAKDIVLVTPQEMEIERFIPGTIPRYVHLEGKLLYDHAA